LLLVGFAAESEIARLTFEHATRHADGIELFLPWRKNDQDARGTKLWVPKAAPISVRPQALEAWLAAGAISDGRYSGGSGACRLRALGGVQRESR
jgi:hypothetical protein